MCFECWWDCLNMGQMAGVMLLCIALYAHLGARLIIKKHYCDDWEGMPDLWVAHPLVVLLTIIVGMGFALVCLTLYGLYGAISCLF